MIQNLRNFLGLYSIVTGGAALLAGIISALLYIFFPELETVIRTLLVVAVVLLALFIVGAYSQVRNTVSSRQTRYGTNTGIMIVAFVGIAVVLNALSVENHSRIDVTEGGQNTLSRQTRNILGDLKEPVRVTGFFTQDTTAQAVQSAAENLLAEYRHQNSKISYEMIDPEQRPGMANEKGVVSNTALVFESEGRRKQVLGVSEGGDLGVTEQNFTGAILNVSGMQQLKVYLLTGHAEKDILNQDPGSGFSFVREGLTADNYAVQSLNLAAINQIPADTALLVVASPQRSFLENEAGLINAYLDQGGKALFMLDPNPRQEVVDILVRWGVVVHGGRIVDQLANIASDMTQPAVVQRSQYTPSVITQEIAATFFPDAVGMSFEVPERDQDHILITPLAVTSPRSYVKVGGADSLNFVAGTDVAGPVPLALTIEANNPIGQRPRPAQENQDPRVTRIAVFADSDFATNQYFYSVGNSDLFLNTVNWLTAQEQLISIRTKPSGLRPIVIPVRAWSFILYSTIAFGPLAVLLVGGIVWWRRR